MDYAQGILDKFRMEGSCELSDGKLVVRITASRDGGVVNTDRRVGILLAFRNAPGIIGMPIEVDLLNDWPPYEYS